MVTSQKDLVEEPNWNIVQLLHVREEVLLREVEIDVFQDVKFMALKHF